MKKDINQVGFSLKKITTEQFAMLDLNIDEEKDIGLNNQFRFGFDKKNKFLIVIALFKFHQNDHIFLIIEVSCHFKITDATLNKVVDNNTKSITLPKFFASHLLVLTIGTTRGILHTKTENTKFNEFILPTVNVNNIITNDVIIDLPDFVKESA